MLVSTICRDQQKRLTPEATQTAAPQGTVLGGAPISLLHGDRGEDATSLDIQELDLKDHSLHRHAQRIMEADIRDKGYILIYF